VRSLDTSAHSKSLETLEDSAARPLQDTELAADLDENLSERGVLWIARLGLDIAKTAE